MNNDRTKIVSLEVLATIVERLRAEGKKIVSTNGTFDLLHVGHVRGLKEAKNLGDVLIVGLNSDSSVREYKSPLRPIIPEAERAEMLASLTCVDYVVIFEETDPIRFLEIVKPDIHAKGEEYDLENLKETPTVKANGGVVRSITRVGSEDGVKSTSKIIEKILKAYG